MSKPPAFQLYAADFYMDTASWSANQVGIYFRLLMWSWINGSLPNCTIKLARIAGIDRGNMEKAWVQELSKKFIPNGDGKLINKRLEEERQKQAIRRELQVKKGEAGADKRWHQSIAPAIAQASQIDSSSSSSSSSSSKKEKNKVVYTPSFLAFWEVYPKKNGKAKAFVEWKKKNPPLETILDAIEKQIKWRSDAGPKDFRPEWKDPERWIRDERWNDEVEEDDGWARLEARAKLKMEAENESA